MIHSTIIRSAFVVLSVQLVTCTERITINQFLSFVDKISLNFEDTRNSITAPNNLKPFKVGHIYETPDVRSQYDGLPDAIKGLLKIFDENTTTTAAPNITTTTPTTTSEMSTSHNENETTTQSSSSISTTTPTTSPTTPTTSPTTPTTSPTTEFSTTISTTLKEELTSMESTMPTPPMDENETKNNDSTNNDSHEQYNLYPVDTEDENNRNARDLSALIFFEVDDDLRNLQNLTDEDKKKVTEVANEITTLATLWSPVVALYKAKLRLFQSYLSGKYPSTFFERIKAKILAKGAMMAKPVVGYQVNRIKNKASSYKTTMKDPFIMDKLTALANAIGELPNLLIKSLTG